jgi:hypothetical protein
MLPVAFDTDDRGFGILSPILKTEFWRKKNILDPTYCKSY